MGASPYGRERPSLWARLAALRRGCRGVEPVDKSGGTFTCPGCGNVCDIEKGMKLLDAIALRRAKNRKRPRP